MSRNLHTALYRKDWKLYSADDETADGNEMIYYSLVRTGNEGEDRSPFKTLLYTHGYNYK